MIKKVKNSSENTMLAKYVAIISLALINIFMPLIAIADNNRNISSNYSSNVLAVGAVASDYAKNNKTLSFIIGFGDFEGAARPEQFGEKLKKLAAENGLLNATYYIVKNETAGYTVAATNGMFGTSFMPPQKMYEKIPELVAETDRVYKEYLR